MKRTIWSNEYDEIRSILDDLTYEYEELEESPDEIELWERAHEINNDYFEDELVNLDDLRADADIIAIADLGLWNGRVTGYKELNTNRIADCLNEWSDCDYITFYVDQYKNLRSSGYHHDGSNSTLFRAWKPETSDEQRENFLYKIYQGKATSRDITRYTERIGDKIAAVYGW